MTCLNCEIFIKNDKYTKIPIEIHELSHKYVISFIDF